MEYFMVVLGIILVSLYIGFTSLLFITYPFSTDFKAHKKVLKGEKFWTIFSLMSDTRYYSGQLDRLRDMSFIDRAVWSVFYINKPLRDFHSYGYGELFITILLYLFVLSPLIVYIPFIKLGMLEKKVKRSKYTLNTIYK